MAADLHIHIYEGINEQDLADFNANTMGSKWFDLRPVSDTRWHESYVRVSATPEVWVGEVSWLKAALLEDAEHYVPNAVGAVNEIIGEDLPVIEDALIAQIRAALELPNQTAYRLADPDVVVQFLEEHRGKQCFIVSW